MSEFKGVGLTGVGLTRVDCIYSVNNYLFGEQISTLVAIFKYLHYLNVLYSCQIQNFIEAIHLSYAHRKISHKKMLCN